MIWLYVLVSSPLMYLACDLQDSPSTPNPNMPVNVEMVINHDSAATGDTILRVHLKAENTRWMQIGQDSSLSNVDWEDFDTLKILHAECFEDSVYRVFVFGRFASGGGGTTGVISDDIIIDQNVKINSIEVFAKDDTLRAGDVIEFTIDAGESGKAYVSITNIKLFYPLDSTGTGIYQRELIIPVGLNEDDVTVTAHFTDAVGNVAEPLEAWERFVIRGPELELNVITHFYLKDVLGQAVWYKDGYCFICDIDSVKLVDVSNPRYPISIKSIYSGKDSKGFDGNNTVLFVPYQYGLAVLTVENPELVHVIETTLTHDLARDVVIDERYVYVSCLSQGLKVFDIIAGYKLSLVGSLRLEEGYGEHICINEKTIYIVGWCKGFVIDVSDPMQPEQLASFSFNGNPQDMLYYGNYLYIATKESGISVVDVRNPYDPILISEHREFSQTFSLALSSPFLYVGGNGNIMVLNATDPVELDVIARIDDVGRVEGLFITDDYLYVSQPCSLSIVELFSDDH